MSAMAARRGLPSTPSAWGSSRFAAPALFAAASEGSPLVILSAAVGRLRADGLLLSATLRPPLCSKP